MKFTKLTISTLLMFSTFTVSASEDSSASKVRMPDRVAAEASLAQDSNKENDLFLRLISEESRGNQFASNGVPLRSPKGAIGVAQIMPETAPEAARLAGLAWSAWRYRNDAEYNKALGRAYFDSQLARYEGNHVLALAAYNAGPGSVDKWLKRFGDPRTGLISNQEFIQMIPFMETKAYVASILNNSSYKFAFSSKTRIEGTASKVEFRDSHPGFTFKLAVNQSLNSGTGKWVGGL